jgi:hypothetical protein
MAKYKVEFPDGNVFEFNSKVAYRWAVVEFDGEKWQVFRKTAGTLSKANDYKYYADINYNRRDYEEYKVVVVEQVC